MKLPSLKSLVADTIENHMHVAFKFYRKGELWYDVISQSQGVYDEVSTTVFTFPVPIEDCGDGVFLAEDKALMFMRYIRKQLDSLKKEIAK